VITLQSGDCIYFGSCVKVAPPPCFPSSLLLTTEVSTGKTCAFPGLPASQAQGSSGTA